MGNVMKTKDGMLFSDFIESVSGNNKMGLPRKLGVVKYYMSHYWDTIKPTFEEIRDRNNAIWDAMVLSGNADGQKKPEAIAAQNEAVAKHWAAETPEFKERMRVERDAERKEAEDGIHRLMSPNDEERTPEEYQA